MSKVESGSAATSPVDDDDAAHCCALVLGNIKDGVECPASKSLRPDEITIEFWLYCDAFKRNSTCVTLMDKDWTCGYGIIGKKPGEFLVFHNNHADDGALERVTLDVEKKKSTWIHFCGTCKGKKQKLYVDGELKAESKLDDAEGPIDYGSEPEKLFLRIGHRLWNVSKFGFVGMIADVRIWNIAKKEREIIRLKQGLPLDSRSRRGLVLHYNFDPSECRTVEGDGVYIRDLSGNGNDGKIIGNACCKRVSLPTGHFPPFVHAGSLAACCHALIAASTYASAKKAAHSTRTATATSTGATGTTTGTFGHAPTFSSSNLQARSLSKKASSSSSSSSSSKTLFRHYHVMRDARIPIDQNIKFSVMQLTFRLTSPAKLDTPYEETFRVVNQSVSRLTVEFPKELQSHRYVLSFEPPLVNVRAGSIADVKATISFKVTTIVEDEIYAGVFQDYAKKSGGLFKKKEVDEEFLPDSVVPLRVVVESELTTHLDFMELLHDEKPIGEGSFGVVYRGEWRGTPVAIKELKVKFMKKQDLEEFHREVRVMEKLRSPYVVNLIGAVFTDQHLAIVTEFMKHGSVKSALNHNRIKNPTTKLRIALDAAHGLDFLHKNNIIHRDVKNDNLLIVSLSSHAPVTVKLTDFGTSRSSSMAIQIEMTSGVGTPAFMAPEILDSKPYSKPADVYSFAITMYELWTGKTPYSSCGFTKPWDIAHFVVKGDRLPIPGDMPPSYSAIMCACWEHDPKKRPTFSDVVKQLEEIVHDDGEDEDEDEALEDRKKRK